MKTHLDLFSGIGGFALAARWAGLKTIQFVEWDAFCQKVLQKNFPGVKIHADIKTFTYAEESGFQTRRSDRVGDADRPCRNKGLAESAPCESGKSRPFLLTGGFPCQPFSCAGKRRGKEDDRYLWPEMLRVVSEAKPTWIIGENVAGFINMGLDDCISDLENQGYEVQAFVIPACAVNAPHRRDRVWIVGAINDRHGLNREGAIEDTGSGGFGGQEFCSQQQERTETVSTNTDRHAADTEGGESGQPSESEGRQDIGRGNRQNAPYADRDRLQEPRAEQRTGGGGQSVQGGERWSEPWLEVAARLCRVDARVSNRVDRLKSLGNAIVPQVAYEIMKAITADAQIRGVVV